MPFFIELLYMYLNVMNMSLSQGPGSLTRGFQESFLLRVVLSLTIQWESMVSPVLEATRPGKIFLTLVWIEGLSKMVWDITKLEMVLDQVVEEMAMEGLDYWMRSQAECILMSTGAAKWGVA